MPASNAHRRLEDAHFHWHDVRDAYHEPQEFRRHLNAAIQDLRNVTFALQGEKRAFPDFDNWYRPWQDRMKANPVLKWLVDARNTVVKRGDLETASTAKLSVRNWLPQGHAVLDVQPFSTPLEIATVLGPNLVATLPPELQTDALLVVERRWHAKNLPEHELLDALTLSYECLRILLVSAHEACGMTAETGGSTRRRMLHLWNQPSCMATPAEKIRSLSMDVETGKVYGLRTVRQKQPPDQALAKAATRYRRIFAGRSLPTTSDIKQQGEFYQEIASRMLAKDGFHVSIAFLLKDGKGVQQIPLVMANQAEKYLAMEALAEQVRRTGADGLVVVSEVWWIPSEKYDGRRPELHPERGEMLQVLGVSSKGPAFTWSTPFTRGLFGRVKLGETTFEEGDPREIGVLTPLLSVWPFEFPKSK